VSRHIIGLAVLAAVSLASAGCGGDPSRIAVFPVEGTVVSAGKPAAKAIVVFHPANPGAATKDGPGGTIATETDDQGKYRLSTYEADDGAPAGDYVVTVRPGGGSSVEDGDGVVRRATPTRALAKYAEPATSPFKATIKPGDNHFDFELNEK